MEIKIIKFHKKFYVIVSLLIFATHSPVRPNLIAISRVKVIFVEDTVIEIESIDAFDDTPVIDIKS